MVGRASYRRAQDRVDDIKWWDDNYNAKFNYLAHSWPGFGDFANWFEGAKWTDQQLKNSGMEWKDVAWMNRAYGSGSGRSIFANALQVSKNVLDLYRV